jgi:hypothetical protein
VFSDLAGHDLWDWHRLGRAQANPKLTNPETSLLVEVSKVTKVGWENPNGGRACPS